MAFTADTSQAKAQIKSLQDLLNSITTGTNFGRKNSLGIDKEISSAIDKVSQLKVILNQSLTPKGSLDLKSFSEGLLKSKVSIKEYGESLRALGPQGQQAFQQLAQSISSSTIQFNKAKGILDEMWATMKNTARWQLTSSMLHDFIGGLQSAYGYAQKLNKSLTDIRIVSGESAESMADFADRANKAAKELGSTTLKYSDASLIYFQQGLDDDAVKERTDATIKMANVTGEAVDQVSSYMTAIWNNFNKAGDESAEHYGDIMTLLGAETAASSQEIAGGLEKFASIGDTIGLSFDYAASAVTTIVDRTRESEDTVGNALKTIFSRMESLKLGETLEDGTDLNKYSKALKTVGIDIKDTSGELKDMDKIIDEVGAKWGELGRNERVALAQTVAGTMQYTRFMALFDNFDFFENMVDLSKNAEGTLEEQNEIYAESWEAASNRIRASFEGMWQDLIDDKFFISLTNGFASLIESVGELLKNMGGLQTMLPIIGALMWKAFGSRITDSLGEIGSRIKYMMPGGKQQIIDQKKAWNDELIKQGYDDDISGSYIARAYQKQGEVTNNLIEIEERLKAVNVELSESERNYAQELINTNQALANNIIEKGKIIDAAPEEERDFLKDIEKRAYGNQVTKLQKEGKKVNPNKIIGSELNSKAKNFKTEVNDYLEQEKQIQYFKNFQKSIVDFDKQMANVDSIEERDKATKKFVNTLKAQKEEISDIFFIDEETSNKMDKALKELETGRNEKGAKKSRKQIAAGLNQSIDIQEKSQQTRRNEIINKAGEDLGFDKKNFTSELDKEANKRRDTSQGAFEVIKDTQKIEENSENIKDKFSKMGQSAINTKEKVTALGQSMINLTMTYAALKSAIDVVNDSEASFGDKLISIVTLIGTALPTIVEFTNIFEMFKIAKTGFTTADTVATAANTAETIKNTSAEMANVASSKASAKANMEEAASQMADTAGSSTAKAGGKVKGLFSKLSAGATAFSGALGGLAIPLAVITTALAAMAGVLYLNYKRMHEAEQQYEQLKESNEKIQTSYEQTKEKANGFTNTVDGLKNKIKELNQLDLGSSKWSQQLSDLNKETRNTINEFNDLNDSIEGQSFKGGSSKNNLKQTALNRTNQKLEEAGYESTNDINLVEGQDYYTDENGAIQITEPGEIKIDTVSDMIVDQANIAINSAKQAENIANEKAIIESFANKNLNDMLDQEVLVDQKNYSFKEALDKSAGDVGRVQNAGANADNINLVGNAQEETKKALLQILDASQHDKTFNLDNLQDKDWLTNVARLDEGIAENIKKSTELQQNIYDSVLGIKQLREDNIARTKEDLLRDEDLGNIYNDYEDLTDKQKKNWHDQTYNQLARGVNARAENYAEDEEKIKSIIADSYGTEGQARKAFAESNNMEYDTAKEKYYKLDEKGEREEKAIDPEEYEEQLKRFVANKEAILESKDALKGILKDLAEDGEKDVKAIKNINQVLTEGGDSLDKAMSKFKNAGKTFKEFKDDADFKEESAQISKFAQLIKGDLTEALDITDKNAMKMIDEDFIANNYELIQQMGNGSEEAANEIRKNLTEAYADETMRVNFDFDDSQIDATHAQLKSKFNSIQDDLSTLEVGMKVDDGTVQAMNQILTNIGATKSQANAMLDGWGVDAEVDDYKVPASEVASYRQGFDAEVVNSDESLNKVSWDVNTKGIGGAVEALTGGDISGALEVTPVKEPSDVPIQSVNYKTGKSQKATGKEGESKVTVWRMKTGKGDKPIVKKNNTTLPPSNANKTTPPSSGSPGDRGSSRRSSPRRSSRTRARARDRKSSQSKYTRYKEIDDTMSRLSKATQRQVKLEDQLYGKKKLDAMKQVNKNLQAELKAIQKKRKEARAYSIIDKNNLQKDLKEAEKNVADAIKKLNKENKNKKSAKLKFSPITEFTFNKYGEITNYTKIMKGIDAQLKSLYKTYNKIKSGDVQSTFYEKRIQPLEEAMSQIEAAVKQYDETRELMIELQEQWNEKYLELLDKNFENLSYQVELKLELTEGSKKLIDYFASKLESDAYKIGELFSYTFTKTYENINDSVAAYTDKNYQLPEGGDKLAYLENIQKQYERGTITQAKYVEGLKEERDALLEQAQSYVELNNKMSSWYNDSLSKVQEELDKYTQNIDQAVSAMEHMKNVLDLSGESKDYNKLLGYQNRIVGLAQQQYEISLKNYEARQNELKTLDDEAKKAIYNEDQQKEYEKQRQNLINQINQTGEEVLSNYETILQGAQTLLETQLEKANKAIDDFLSDTVGGFDELLDQMDRTSDRQDEYLTKTNQIYEMNKMLRTLRQDMDKSDNKAAKQRMKNFENELTGLKEKGELSQLELQIAQARYEQLKAQIALEEAQNAKQTVRLRRDNEGNYGYVYTANEDQINDAEQSLDDANNNLYNIYLEASNNYNQKIIDQTQNLLSKLQDIENSDLSKEEKQQLRETAIAQYKELINTSAKLAEIGQNGLKIDFGASGEDWVSKYTGPVQNILGNLDGSLKEYLEKIDSANEDYQKIYDKYFEQTNKIAENIYNTSQNSWKKLMGEDGDSGILRKLNNEMLEQVKKVSAWLEKLAIILAKIGNLEDLLKDLNKDITAENTGENAIASNTNYNQLLSDIATNGYNGKITSTDFSKDNDAARVFTDSKGNVMSFNAVAKAMKENSKVQAYNEKVAKKLIEERTKGNVHGLLGYNSKGELVYVTTNSSVTDTKKLKDQLAKKIGGNTSLQNAKDTVKALKDYKEEKEKKRPNKKTLTKLRNKYNNLVEKTFSKKTNQDKYKITKNTDIKKINNLIKGLNSIVTTRRNNYWEKSNHEFVQFKTGGYTGDWAGQNGKLAMLHQKEMILNKDDTKNLLASVDVIRGIVSSIDLQALSRQYGSNVSSQNLTNFNGNNLQQDVRISAEFPNVRDRSEIEAAFDNLVNRAAQYANRRV